MIIIIWWLQLMPFDQSMTQDVEFLEDMDEEEADTGGSAAPSLPCGPSTALPAPNNTTTV